MLPGIGEEGVALLRRSRVLILGCGALGSLCAMYLAASGVGTIAIADFDTIDITNLQRQLFYTEAELGSSKCKTLAAKMRAINSGCNVVEISELINREKAAEHFQNYDFVIDGSDNPATKKMTAEVCEKKDVAYCIGGVREFSGQVMTWVPGHAGYAEIFGDTPSCSGFTPCSVGGVLGPVAGIVASVQAAEAIKFLTHSGKFLTDKLFTFDLSTPTANVF